MPERLRCRLVNAPRDVYTHGHHESVLRSHRWRTVDNSASYLVPHLRPGIELLDVGCGPGTITADFARRVAPGRVVGIDRSPGIVDDARAGSAEANADYAVGDVYALEFADDSFDVVHAHQVLQHLTDPVAALREMGRVCRPSGVVAARDSDYGAKTWFPASPWLDRWLDMYRRVARGNGAEPDGGRHILSWAQRAGFMSVVPTASAWCFATPHDRAWWGELWAVRIVESDLARQAVDGGYATTAELASMAVAWREWADHDDGWFVVVHGEVLCSKTSGGPL